MPLTDEDKENLRTVLRGDISFAKMIKKIVAKYKHEGLKMSEINTKK